jgi:hypothetical protein
MAGESLGGGVGNLSPSEQIRLGIGPVTEVGGFALWASRPEFDGLWDPESPDDGEASGGDPAKLKPNKPSDDGGSAAFDEIYDFLRDAEESSQLAAA